MSKYLHYFNSYQYDFDFINFINKMILFEQSNKPVVNRDIDYVLNTT